jgi:hypothetical protein
MEKSSVAVKSSVLAWSIGLGFLFIVSAVAVSVTGTKANATFTYVGSKHAQPGTTRPVPTSPDKPGAERPAPSQSSR